jgi:UDPglucose--hexose-1-phosphate uridylyltransferase
MHELRKDPLFSRWVAVLDHSQGPEAYRITPDDPEPIETGGCPLCPGREAETPPEVAAIRAPGTGANAPGWRARAVPSFRPVLLPGGELGRKGVGMYDRMNGVGVNEIIIESPEHSKGPEDLGPRQMTDVIELYRERIVEIQKDARIRHVLVCKNSGRLAGAAYRHPHAEVIAAPVIPQYIKGELDGAKQYYAWKERCIFCDILEEERRAALRLIAETERFLAFCPYAPMFPFEFWIVPKTHRCAFEDIGPEEMEDLGNIFSALLGKMRKVLRDPSYNYVLHTSPNRIPRKNHWHTLGEDFHWHIEVVPRLSRASGIELSSGFYVLRTSPEDAAKYLREA